MNFGQHKKARAGSTNKSNRSVVGTCVAQYLTPQPTRAEAAHTTCVKWPVASEKPAGRTSRTGGEGPQHRTSCGNNRTPAP